MGRALGELAYTGDVYALGEAMTRGESRPARGYQERVAEGRVEKETRKPHVVYRSSALSEVDPALVGGRGRSVREAGLMAERVREEFRRSKGEDEPVDEDGLTNEQKYERRLILNRKSAAASRVRREAYIKALEQQCDKIEVAFDILIAQHAKEKKQREEMEEAKRRSAGMLSLIEDQSDEQAHADELHCAKSDSAGAKSESLGTKSENIEAVSSLPIDAWFAGDFSDLLDVDIEESLLFM